MKNKTTSLKIGVGTATILMIFVVLCMVILSVLSLQEAQMNEALVNKEKDYTQAYYEAKTKADLIYNEMCDTSVSLATRIENVEQQYEVRVAHDAQSIRYVVAINEQKQLQVIVKNDETLAISSYVVQNNKGEDTK